MVVDIMEIGRKYKKNNWRNTRSPTTAKIYREPAKTATTSAEVGKAGDAAF